MQPALGANWSWTQALNGLRMELLDALNDSDLAFNPGGTNSTLGELLVSMAEVERSYILSLGTFTQDWHVTIADPSVSSSVAALNTLFGALQTEFEATLNGISETDLERQIERPGGGQVSADFQLQAYLQAMFIFFGKFVVYLNAMQRELPPTIREFIG